MRLFSSSSILAQLGPDGTPLVTPPHDVAEELNKRFPMEDQGELYFTMFYGVFNRKTGLLQYVSAGHVPPVLFRKNGKPEILPAEGFAIGWIDGIDYDLEQVTLEPGDRLFVFSDGVPEAMDQDLNELGDQRMLQSIEETGELSLEESVAHVKSTVDGWCRVNGPKDDVSILAVEMPE